jgi:hypothetical protein
MSADESPIALGVNVFTAPGKTVVGERPKPFGPPLGWDPITSTLIYGEYDAVLVDPLTTVYEANALAEWAATHPRPPRDLLRCFGVFGARPRRPLVQTFCALSRASASAR